MIQNLNFAYYEKQDWEYLMSIIPDRDNMPETWEEWHEKLVELMMKFNAEGFTVRKVKVDIAELIKYCNDLDIPVDGSARAQFVQQK